LAEPDLQSLRNLIPPSVGLFWKTIIEPVILVMEALARIKMGTKENRIGVFGPYLGGDREMIMRVAKMVSELNFAAVTGEGFFLPREPKVFHSIRELIPPYAQKARRAIPSHVFFHEFPRLVSKGIFFENDERGQFVELQGCSEYEIPVLGFIIHRTISGSKNCNFLTVKNTYSECEVTDKEFCLHQTRPEFFCPFYDSINIPWFSKELFMTKENRLIALKRIIALRKILKEFL